MQVQAEDLVQLQEGVYVLLRAQEVGSISSGCQMVTFLIRAINQFASEKVRHSSSLEKVMQMMRHLLVGIRELVPESYRGWMSNLAKEEQLQMQAFIRLCLVKLEKHCKSANNPSENSEFIHQGYKQEVITIINQLKIQNPDFDVVQCLKSMLEALSCVSCPSFNMFVLDIVDYFSLEVHFKHLLEEPLRKVQTPPKYKQRSHLVQELMSINSDINRPEGKEGKVTASTKVAPVPLNPAFHHDYKKCKQPIERTIFYSHPFKYTFRGRAYGLI